MVRVVSGNWKMNGSRKEIKKWFQNFFKKVEIFEEEPEDGRILKAVHFKFPVFFDGLETRSIFPNQFETVETVVSLVRETPDSEGV